MPDEYTFPDEQEKKEVVVAAPTDEVEVEIVDDTPEADRGRKALDREVTDPTEEEIDSYSDGVKKRIKELTHARHDERRIKEATLREKQELEAFARRLMEENKRLQGHVVEGTKNLTSVAMQQAEQALAAAKAKMYEASQAFDSEKLVAAQEEITDAKLRLDSLKNFRPAPLQAEENQVQTQQATQPVVQPDEKSLRWQAKNQWFGADGFEEITSYALGLHQKLVNSGVDPRSDEYYRHVDDRIRGKFPEVFSQAPANGNRRPASVVAPASRTTGARKVQLTATQVALAKKFNLTPQQYAVQVAKLETQNGA